MTLTLSVVDAFTDRPFAGNPAAVAVLEHPLPDETLGRVAAEMNLAETAFVAPRGDGDWDLRWFTPTTEVDLCGHATLATAKVLGGELRFHTRSGVLAARTGADGSVELDFPADPPVAAAMPSALAVALGCEPLGAHRARHFLVAELTELRQVLSHAELRGNPVNPLWDAEAGLRHTSGEGAGSRFTAGNSL